jgi:multiple sugar transport system substrate-binding protein
MSFLHPTRTRTKVLQTAVLASVVALALAGCGRSSDSASPAAATKIDDKPATGTVTLWAPDGDATALKDTLKPFEKANPDVDVKVTLIPSDQYNTKLQTAIAGGTTPDIAQLYTEAQAQFIGSDAFAPVPSGLVDPASFFPGAWKAGAYKGTTYSVPWYAYTYALIYRKDLAATAGVSAPTKISDMVPFFKALQSAGAAHGFGAEVGWDSYSGQDAVIYTWQEGGDVINSDDTKWTFADNPAFLKAVTEYSKFFTEGTASVDTPQFLDAQPYFVAGKTAALVSGPWVISSLDTTAKQKGWTAEHVATAPLPSGSAGNVGPVAGGSWGVLKDSKNSEAAWKVIRFLAQPDTQVAQYKSFGSMPAVVSAWDDPSIADQPLMKVFSDQLKNTKSYPQVTTWSQVATQLGKELEAVARGTETPEQLAKNMQTFADGVGTGN